MNKQCMNNKSMNNQVVFKKKIYKEVGVNMFEKFCIIGVRSGLAARERINTLVRDERGDVPGWVLIVLMTTGLVTGIWAIAKPNLTNILQNSLNSMNGIR